MFVSCTWSGVLLVTTDVWVLVHTTYVSLIGVEFVFTIGTRANSPKVPHINCDKLVFVCPPTPLLWHLIDFCLAASPLSLAPTNEVAYLVLGSLKMDLFPCLFLTVWFRKCDSYVIADAVSVLHLWNETGRASESFLSVVTKETGWILLPQFGAEPQLL